MLERLFAIIGGLGSLLQSQRHLALENLALRQQVAMLRHSVRRPKTMWIDRVFWVVFLRHVREWRAMLHALHPDTVVRWHRQGFRRYWRWKSRRPGRPSIDGALRRLIREMQSDNVGWGAPRIHGELLKLGFKVSQATVSKYMVRHSRPPSQSWRTFLDNHAKDIVGIDFFTVPTATFRILHVFVILGHERQLVRHFNVTANPTASWTAQQIVEAFPWDEAPKYLLRDRDSIYGHAVQRRIKSLGIEEIKIAPRSPWQSPFVERLIGSVRRDCLNHVIVLNERHLRRLLRDYFDYYHVSRTHLSLSKDPPIPRPIDRKGSGQIVGRPQVGGLHHHYRRLAA